MARSVSRNQQDYLLPPAKSQIENRQSTITRHGAMAVVLSEDRQRVLLLRREIFILWDLPGGGIEKNEAPLDAAVRECREETGIEIQIERLVGRYVHQSVYGRGDQLTHVFAARAIGGRPKRIGLEITGLRWCRPDDLPRGLQPLHRQMIADALAAGAAVERRIEFPVWQLYPARVVFFVLRVVNDSIRRGLRKVKR
jgi:8-oxo-dGTP pyrophosphatase MutT (NUDIX family)